MTRNRKEKTSNQGKIVEEEDKKSIENDEDLPEFRTMMPNEYGQETPEALETKAMETEEVEAPVYGEALLQVLENGKKPWFLKAAEVYDIVKHAVEVVPKSEVLFDRSLKAIEAVAKFINDSTRFEVLFEAEQAYTLIHNLDELLTRQLVNADERFDKLREKLCTSIRSLMKAVIGHQVWSKSITNEAKEEQSSSAKKATRLEAALALFRALIDLIEEKLLPATLQSFLQTSRDSFRSTRSAVSPRNLFWNLLHTAQPYVHKVVTYGMPYYDKATEISTPYYEKLAAPYVVPAVTTADTRIKNNKFIGKYYSEAVDTSKVLLEEVKQYAIPNPKEE